MCVTGWLSPSLLYLKSSESHLQNGAITNEESSWIGKGDLWSKLDEIDEE